MTALAPLRPVPDLHSFDPPIARRVAVTVSCPDADGIPKVDEAGLVREEGGRRVQVMHNGVLVEEGGYYGDWMEEIIRTLRGHHEPQEERVFDEIVRRLADEGGPATMIEFGSFWTYYGLWFCHAIPSARAIAVEPDPAYLDVGRRNAALNDLVKAVTFVQAAIGDQPGQPLTFRAESDNQDYQVDQCDLRSVLRTAGLDRADLVLADVQGAESTLLQRGRDDFRAGRVRFLLVSTHHHSISGHPLTHQEALQLLLGLGAHVICEHTVSESYSGDGLIAVSFDERDRDLTVHVSRARAKDSLFGELEYELAASLAQRLEMQRNAAETSVQLDSTRKDLEISTTALNRLRNQLIVVERQRDELKQQLAAIAGTKLWRWSQRPRRVYGRVKSWRHGRP